jgi:DNA-binding transcriptional MocR family regulator
MIPHHGGEESMDLETSTLLQRAVASFLKAGELESHLTRMAQAHRERSGALVGRWSES